MRFFFYFYNFKDLFHLLFSHRWNTIGWPRKITDQIETTENQLEEDEKKFQKNLQSDQANFEDRLDTLEVQHSDFVCTPADLHTLIYHL